MARDEPHRRERPTSGEFVYAENYTVVAADTVDDLIAQVQRLLSRGWKVTGGVATLPTGGPVLTGSYFYQALVLPAESE